jgi:photosystem II stability/assembly factor-like uncharacterized protein
VSTDGGTVWEEKDSYYDDGGCCIVHPDSAHIILTGGKGPLSQTNWSFVVSRSRNTGANWTRHVLSGASSGYCYALAVAASSRNVIYAGGEVSGVGAVYRSTDFGATWSRTTASPGGTVLGLAVHPQDANRVFCATVSGVFVSTDAGGSWTSRPGTAGSAAVAFYPDGPDTVVAGGDYGVVISWDRGATWTRLGSGIEGQTVACLGFAERGGPFLIAGTAGSACFGWQFWTGISEPARNDEHGTMGREATVVRGILFVPACFITHRSSLITSDGRKVMELEVGANDVRSLTPGVYFVRAADGAGNGPNIKVVKTR